MIQHVWAVLAAAGTAGEIWVTKHYPVCSFTEEEQALLFARRLNRITQNGERKKPQAQWRVEKWLSLLRESDPEADWDDEKLPFYFVKVMPLYLHVDEVIDRPPTYPTGR